MLFLLVCFSQTYECRLHNIKSKDSSDWSESANSRFMELCDATDLVMHVLLVSLLFLTIFSDRVKALQNISDEYGVLNNLKSIIYVLKNVQVLLLFSVKY